MATQWNLHVRWLDIDGDARFRSTLDYRLSPKLTVGLEANSDQVLPRATWFAQRETGAQPSVTVGVGADRLSTPEGYAAFATVGKTIASGRASVFGGFKLSTEDRALAFPYGTNVMLDRLHTLQAVYDGNYTHLLLTRRFEGVAATLVFARTRHWGIQFGMGF